MIAYIIIGLVGVYMHIQTKPKEGVKLFAYIKREIKSVITSLLSFGVLLYFWYDGVLTFVGLPEGEFNAMTFVIGYFSTSFLGHVMKQFQDRFMKGKPNASRLP